MPKNRKKRRLDGNIYALTTEHNLTGFDGQGSDSLADCLAELNGNAPAAQSIHANKQETSTEARKDSSQSFDIGSRGDTPSLSKAQHIDFDRVENWNQMFHGWTKGGNYPPGLLPSIDEELARHFHVQGLSKSLLKRGKDLRMPVFERWLLDVRLEDDKSRDPVLPVASQPSSPASQRLVKELVHNGVDQDTAEQVVAELCRSANLAGQELVSRGERYQRTSPLKKGDSLELERHESTVTLLYSRKKWKKPFCFPLNSTHYQKLKDRFFHVHANAASLCKLTPTKKAEGSRRGALTGFHIVVLSLLLRYSSLSGGQLLQDLRGGGMQGAIHEEVFDVLQATWSGPWVEGFASPFNVCLSQFGSAFLDLDWHFGSIGSFTERSFVRKNQPCRCEANPPFSPGVMNMMVDHMADQLRLADRKGAALTFVVIVPTALTATSAVQEAATASFQRMISDRHCRKHIRLTAKEHGYIEGAQHLRPTRYKQSTYDTSLIVLQSKTDLDLDFDEVSFEKKIRSAFVSQHLQELKRRREETN